MADDIRLWLALREAPGFGRVLIRRLADALGSAEAIFTASEKDLARVDGIGSLRAAALKDFFRRFDRWERVDAEMQRAGRMGVSLLALSDPDYPELLRNIPDPPAVLYVRGRLEKSDSRSVAVVGTRVPSRYGLEQTERLAGKLAGSGLTVVSGLALGIDAAAHRAAMAAGGRTIAVLGCGLDIIYPPENRALFFDVMGSGAVVSEYPLGTPPDRPNFPERNRIISGLSLGTVVVEAARGSGSLITARCALEQNREVFAVPGSVNAPGSRGTNNLLKQGARLVEDAEDVLAELKGPLTGMLEPAAASKQATPPREALTDEEAGLLRWIEHEPKQMDQIATEGGLDAARAMALLLSLELKGYVLQGRGMTYVRA